MQITVRRRGFTLIATVVAAVTTLVAVAMTGYALWPDSGPDCVAPQDEARLLDELAKDPSLSVVPTGASRRFEPRRQKACQVIGKDITTTSVSVEYDLPRALNEAEVRALFEPVTARAGWSPMPSHSSGHGGDLHYCRTVDGRPQLMSLHWHDPQQLDTRTVHQQIKGVFFVGVFGWADNARGNAETARMTTCP